VPLVAPPVPVVLLELLLLEALRLVVVCVWLDVPPPPTMPGVASGHPASHALAAHAATSRQL
jgi:hypothetical protein